MWFHGFKAMIPILSGVLPFGLVVGTVCADAKLSLLQTIGMNSIVFAGASQLVAVDLMVQGVPVMIVVITGIVINLRFMLYSASLSTLLKDTTALGKAFTAYSLTDQAYALFMGKIDQLSKTKDKLNFFWGSATCMLIAWQLSVALGFLFGNFAPDEWSLEFGIPLCFVALVIPRIKNKIYLIVAITAAGLSVILHQVPYNLGLLATALVSIGMGAFLTRKR